ncbi:hypothetical protein [Streptomyces filamentosus]|uniref:hypothetical protein n=1 Tax=Streptomyces filamentosus TaxID=67294 RepID=UPI00123C3865|nr:hypothetical protein [Streptomyces filamentosus]KAA6216434.1 hypothetical protein CP979_05345 [Streptomyces filamentosus]
MTASSHPVPVIHCDGEENLGGPCDAETTHPDARTAADVRRLRTGDGWHTRPGGRDICPDCWKDGLR